MHFRNTSEIVICIKFSVSKKTQKCPIFDIFEHKRAFSRKSKHFEKFSSCGIFFLCRITPRKHHITQHYRFLFSSAYGLSPVGWLVGRSDAFSHYSNLQRALTSANLHCLFCTCMRVRKKDNAIWALRAQMACAGKNGSHFRPIPEMAKNG